MSTPPGKLTIYWNGKPSHYTSYDPGKNIEELITELVKLVASDQIHNVKQFGLSSLENPSIYFDKTKSGQECRIQSGDTLLLILKKKRNHIETREDKSRANLLLVYAIVIFIPALMFFIELWPSNQTLMSPNVTRTVFVIAPQYSFTVGGESLLVMMIVIAGVVGACIYSMYAIALHRGLYKDFDRAWTAWYLTRPLIGAGLALAFYLVVGAGIVNLGNNVNLNLVGVTALAILVGIFSEHTMNKLLDVADTLFGSGPAETQN